MAVHVCSIHHFTKADREKVWKGMRDITFCFKTISFANETSSSQLRQNCQPEPLHYNTNQTGNMPASSSQVVSLGRGWLSCGGLFGVSYVFVSAGPGTLCFWRQEIDRCWLNWLGMLKNDGSQRSHARQGSKCNEIRALHRLHRLRILHPGL